MGMNGGNGRKVGIDDEKVGMDDADKSEQTVGNMWESVPMGEGVGRCEHSHSGGGQDLLRIAKFWSQTAVSGLTC